MEDDRTAGVEDAEQPGWYVSQVVGVPAERVRAVAALGAVVASDGSTLRVGGLVARGLPLEDHVSYEGMLSLGGGMLRRMAVEVVVTRYSGSLAEVGIRPAAKVPSRRIGARRYFDSAWSVLDALARAASVPGAGSGRVAEVEPVRTARAS